jgi:hypothetical protein
MTLAEKMFGAAVLAAAGTIAACGGGGATAPGPVVTGGQGPTGNPPTAQRERWTPAVIPETQSDPVLYEVVMTGKPTSATLSLEAGGTIELRDDGAGGDKVAGDGTWTASIPAATILGRNTPEWVNRPYLGALKLGGASGTYNVFAEVWTAAIGTRTVYPVEGGGQETDYVVNYTASADQLANLDPAVWTRRFYAAHPDQFDFINVVAVAGARDNRHHIVLKNTVSGTGDPKRDNSGQYGSAGHLLGLTVFPMSPAFDAAGKAFSHEIGHQWMNFLPIQPFAASSPHWPRGSVAMNVMGFSIGPLSEGGEFPYTFSADSHGGYLVGQADPANSTTFSMLELYLMGLARADEVPDYFTLKDQQRTLIYGQTLAAADVVPLRLADIVAAVGPRSPDVDHAQKAFRAATIVLSEQPLDARAMALFDYFARRGEARATQACADGRVPATCKPWYVATGGRSTMAMNVR